MGLACGTEEGWKDIVGEGDDFSGCYQWHKRDCSNLCWESCMLVIN